MLRWNSHSQLLTAQIMDAGLRYNRGETTGGGSTEHEGALAWQRMAPNGVTRRGFPAAGRG